MRMIKVYQLFGLHPIYSELIDNPPVNVQYINKPKIRKEKIGWTPTKLIISKISKIVPLIRLYYIMSLKVVALIHSLRGILILKKLVTRFINDV